jgi:anti-anti-sigma factor
MPLTVHSEPGPGFVTIRPTGSLDSYTYPELSERVVDIMKGKPRVLVFDLKELHYISSAGVRVILWTRRTMRAAGGDVALTNLQPLVRKVFEFIKALPTMNVFESADDLDRYLAGVHTKAPGDGKKE